MKRVFTIDDLYQATGIRKHDLRMIIKDLGIKRHKIKIEGRRMPLMVVSHGDAEMILEHRKYKYINGKFYYEPKTINLEDYGCLI